MRMLNGFSDLHHEARCQALAAIDARRIPSTITNDDRNRRSRSQVVRFKVYGVSFSQTNRPISEPSNLVHPVDPHDRYDSPVKDKENESSIVCTVALFAAA